MTSNIAYLSCCHLIIKNLILYIILYINYDCVVHEVKDGRYWHPGCPKQEFFSSYFPCPVDIDTFERRQFVLVILRLRVLRSSHQARAPTSVGIGWLHSVALVVEETPRTTAMEPYRLRNTFCPLQPSSSIARCGQLRHLQTRRGVRYVIIHECAPWRRPIPSVVRHATSTREPMKILSFIFMQ